MVVQQIGRDPKEIPLLPNRIHRRHTPLQQPHEGVLQQVVAERRVTGQPQQVRPQG